ncbi:hypothetical protein Agabi119p4_5207 [Agaricus bisporus var. burnettii]|uniref:Uncharacterized protein n=1 Tax=Agaricus bisporus var. burnettii TaxID=192524 RepID=A0A8H7F527_AGABI|nr:hypothetical protein Agabi119p4_5207 [Agaricus bisporus var. burnettii]
MTFQVTYWMTARRFFKLFIFISVSFFCLCNLQPHCFPQILRHRFPNLAEQGTQDILPLELSRAFECFEQQKRSFYVE